MRNIRLILLFSLFYIPFSEIKAQNNPVPTPADGDYHGCSYVDLGLPSGTLWATCNLGAKSPEEAGDYYAWGEISPKLSFTWENYRFGDGKVFTKYNIFDEGGPRDNLNALLPEDDAAVRTLAGSWRIPSQEQVDELVRRCSWSRQTVNDVQGYLGTGPNGKSIFFPDSGYFEDDHFEPGGGFYWMSELVPFAIPDDMMDALLGKTKVLPQIAFSYSPMSVAIYTGRLRKDGLTIRPVASSKSIFRSPDPAEAFPRVVSTPGDLIEYRDYAFIWRDTGTKQQYHATSIDKEDIAAASSYDRLLKDKAWKEYLTRIPDNKIHYTWAEDYLYDWIMEDNFRQARSRLMKSRAARQVYHEHFTRKNVSLNLIQEETGYGITLDTGDYLIAPKYSQIYVYPSQENGLTDRILLAKLDEDKPYTAYTLDEAPAEGEFCVVKKECTLEGIGTHDKEEHYKFVWKDAEGKAYTWYVLPKDDGDISVNDFITHYLKLNTTEWFKQNEFETLAEYQKRITYPFYGYAVEGFAKEALRLYLKLYDKKLFTLDRYDVENETFLVKSPLGDIPLKVEYDVSRDFLTAWNRNEVKLVNYLFKYNGAKVKLSNICFKYKDHLYDGATSYAHMSYLVSF